MILKLPTKRSLLEVISFENLFINNLYQNTSLPMTSEIKQDYPLNLSISVSGGKETNKDCPSNGEWTGKSSNCKSMISDHRIVI